MSSEKFIKNNTVLTTLVSACLIVIISLGIRQTFGMFYFDFSIDLEITLSQFGFAMGLQMLLWGVFGPWFGVITDKYGGHIAVFIGFIFYLAGIFMLYSQYNTGLYFVTAIGVLIGVALGATAISIPVSVVAKHFPQSNRTLAMGDCDSIRFFWLFCFSNFHKILFNRKWMGKYIINICSIHSNGINISFSLNHAKRCGWWKNR